MLYVFLVDTGVMMTFEMNIALESVLVLKKAIQSRFGIPLNAQVLLINGGESLHNSNRVCQYSGTGTDTSPIYLFNKTTIEQQVPPSIPLLPAPSQQQQQFFSTSPLSGSPLMGGFAFEHLQAMNNIGTTPASPGPPQQHMNLQQDELQIKAMRSKVADSLNMLPSYSTIVARTEIARQLHDMTMKQLSDCEQLIKEQHLQHQGWQAVVANLEDISTAFVLAADAMKSNFNNFLAKRTKYQLLLEQFPTDLLLLEEIPVLKFENSLDANEKYVQVNQMDSINLNESIADAEPEFTLLEWINSKDSSNTLQQLADSCRAVMEHLDEDQLQKMEEETLHIRSLTENEDNKKIKKIEDRLYHLDETLAQAKKIVQEQSGLTKAFIQNQNSVQSVRDQAIFDDLCISHCTQLKLMLENFEKLANFKRRYLKAKNELICSLHSRLRVIMHTEKELSFVNSKILIYSENLKKLRRQLEILAQVHMAPVVYFKAINEILRRRQFTCCFRAWADKLHNLCRQIYESETATRNSFKSLIADHFLSSLFFGLDDEFPSVFQELPPEFDSNLPSIQQSDVDRLRQVAVVLQNKLTQIKRESNEPTELISIEEENDSFKFSIELLQETESLLSDLPLPCPVCGRQSQTTSDNADTRQSQTQQTSTTDIGETTKKSESDEFETLSEDETKKRFVPKQISTETAMEALEAIESSDDNERKNLSTPPDYHIRELLQQQKKQLSEEYERKMQEMQTQFEQRLSVELTKLKAQLKCEHKLEMDTVRSRFKLASALERSSMDRSFMAESLAKTGATAGTSPGGRDTNLSRLNESLREKEIQIEHLRRSEKSLCHILARISSKVQQKDADPTEVCSAIKEVLEMAKMQHKLTSSLIVDC